MKKLTKRQLKKKNSSSIKTPKKMKQLPNKGKGTKS